MISIFKYGYWLWKASLATLGLVLAAVLFSSPVYANYDSCVANAQSAYDDGADNAYRAFVGAGSTTAAEEAYYDELSRLSGVLNRAIDRCGAPPPPPPPPDPGHCPDGTSRYDDPECDGSNNGENSPEDDAGSGDDGGTYFEGNIRRCHFSLRSCG